MNAYRSLLTKGQETPHSIALSASRVLALDLIKRIRSKLASVSPSDRRCVYDVGRVDRPSRYTTVRC